MTLLRPPTARRALRSLVGACVLLAVTSCGSSAPGRGGPSSGSSPTTAGPTTAGPTTAGPSSGGPSSGSPTSSAFRITSPSIRSGGPIPVRFTCNGLNVSPPLTWRAVPDGAGSLALVVDDPDAPGGTFTHWLVVDIPPRTTGTLEGSPPPGGRQVTNSSGGSGYVGPCPPSGTHHYRFTVYALPGAVSATGLSDVLAAVSAEATASARLVGTYGR